MRHHAKFCEDRANRSGDMADFRFFKIDRQIDRYIYLYSAYKSKRFTRRLDGQEDGRPPSWICFKRVRTTHDGLCDCAKFGCNRCSNFDSMQILIFCTLSLKMLIHAPKIRGFGGFYPQNGDQYERDPQKAFRLGENTSYDVQIVKIGPACARSA